ncbi:MAG: hypothetical protein KU38_04460 [Sulfurovum sp. FS08-3]|nr:MAG: hypothetical protein KU38_04460 [Sulfurovum sp. FS08-3]
MKTQSRNQDKQRAIFSYQCVGSFVNENRDENQKRYRAYIRSIPSMILNNGLGSTIAFMFSKRLKKEGEVYNQIGENIFNWLREEQNRYLIALENKDKAEDKLKELTDKVIYLNSSEYRATTNELLALFNWLKRFADGMIEGDKEDGKKEKK